MIDRPGRLALCCIAGAAIAAATSVLFSACADHGLSSDRLGSGNASIGHATYDWQGHGFEEPWPFGPLRNNDAASH